MNPTTHESMVDRLARRVVVPLALALDIVQMLIRVLETTMRIILPDAYTAWQAHAGLLAPLFYLSAVTVMVSMAIGLCAMLYLVMPLTYLINKRIESLVNIRNKKVKAEMTRAFTAKKKRYNGLLRLAISVPILFSISYFFPNGGVFVTLLTAAADIAAPIIILYVISNAEKEIDDIDPQETTSAKARAIALDGLERINPAAGLSVTNARMLRHGLDGNLSGMIDAAIPREAVKKVYTITEICGKLGVSSAKDSPDRKAIWRTVKRAAEDYPQLVDKDKRGYLFPGQLWDEYFGDFTPSESRRTDPGPAAAFNPAGA